ncbi:hypothetical protein EMIHUDRAFT_74740 [Emiliania huxleyi CCMP1516]|uniref:Protease Do-like PDZ domain-containing protein n=2 Tax=Emiliania huxleyi TaxID=2903 RepID=A0A0D3JEK8_EMIH1|nr:hypothetical protein EMIHUDRAFT_74740 [Emiliania huxleyi CCMP1516]EOD21943.1 hypothetical protein EMIHUDRAFT_74740 [Emiliania huxleyi CCMP1516]|eukprot:XP_005774372.1 hypothetical protein EMIHUDRAFT_74740 [Emiliania huxleyi CCMP1516]
MYTCLALALALSPRSLSVRRRASAAQSRRCGPPVGAADVDIYGRAVLAPLEASASTAEPVVKVYSVHCSVNVAMPWSNKPQEESTGSGFTMRQQHDGQLVILTNAHCVADATYVEVRKAGDSQKHVAQVARIAHECDLATLTVSDDAFWEGVEPLEFGPMPSLQDEVSVVGYPEGGEGVSVTQGVVSRIEIQRYAHSGANLLAVQIDAAINPGNSGGPALNADGDVIGVAFQNQLDSQNIGYVIPAPIIAHYLVDDAPSDPRRPAGFPSLGIFWQAPRPAARSSRRSYLGMEGRTGVRIRGVAPTAPAAALLRTGDVLLEPDGSHQPPPPRANHPPHQPTTRTRALPPRPDTPLGGQERLSFAHLIHLKFAHQTIGLRVLRAGEARHTHLVPVRPLQRLIPPTAYDEPLPYFIYAGLVFVPFVEPYLHEWGDDWQQDAPHELVQLVLSGAQSEAAEQPVLLSRVLPSPQTAGYLTLADRRVLSVNGERVLNLRQMHALVQRLQAECDHLAFEVQCVGGPAVIAIDTSTAEQEAKAILETYRIPAAASPDLCGQSETDAQSGQPRL